MTPREKVEDALRRLTDGTLTFRMVEDDYTVVAARRVDGLLRTQLWSKRGLDEGTESADDGVRELLRKLNEAD